GLVLCFALGAVDLERLGRELVRVAHPDGAVWIVVWKKTRLPPDAPGWDEVQEAVLGTGWVDNKILSLGEDVYATRYVRRRRSDAGPAQVRPRRPVRTAALLRSGLLSRRSSRRAVPGGWALRRDPERRADLHRDRRPPRDPGFRHVLVSAAARDLPRLEDAQR